MNKQWLFYCAFIIIFLVQLGCGSSTPPRHAKQSPPGAKSVSLPLFRPAKAHRDQLPEVIRANNTFALSIYHRVRSEPGNILISPASLTAGLGLLRAGARGESALELDHLLHRSVTLPDHALAAMVKDLNADGQNFSFQIRLANTLWIPRDYTLLDDFRASLRDTFGLDDACRIDFDESSDKAAREINAWVSTRTGGKITGAINPEILQGSTKLILTSALYFRGNWREGFLRSSTKDEPFHVTRTKVATVPMMHQHSFTFSHGYLDAGSFQVVSLSCGQGAFSLDVLLPKEIDGLADLEATLTPEMLDALWPKLKQPDDYDITLPRFRVQSSRGMVPVLKDLGLSRTLSQDDADFSGINGKRGDLFVTDVTHETLVDVNEEGIEAASFTGLISADAFGDDPPPVVRADHPFLYLLRDTSSGCIVFIGRFVEPFSR